jgi:hypothetical protein
MYFPDLSPHSYHSINPPPADVLSIGWLGRGVAFTTGVPPEGFADKLAALIRRERVRQTRGYHACSVCGASMVPIAPNDPSVLLGSAEVWVPGDRCIYAAPTLILHYVTSHAYLPPREFVDAAMAFDLGGDWHAADEVERRLGPGRR